MNFLAQKLCEMQISRRRQLANCIVPPSLSFDFLGQMPIFQWKPQTNRIGMVLAKRKRRVRGLGTETLVAYIGLLTPTR